MLEILLSWNFSRRTDLVYDVLEASMHTESHLVEYLITYITIVVPTTIYQRTTKLL